MPSNDERVTIRMSPTLRRQLEDIAEKQERSISQQLRKIALDWLAGQRRQQAQRTRYRAPASPSTEAQA
jgi:predicted transcriptional regulator